MSGGDEGAISPWVVLLLKANPGWRLFPFGSYGKWKRVPIMSTVGAAFSGAVTEQAALSQPHGLSPPASPEEGSILPWVALPQGWLDGVSFFP